MPKGKVVMADLDTATRLHYNFLIILIRFVLSLVFRGGEDNSNQNDNDIVKFGKHSHHAKRTSVA